MSGYYYTDLRNYFVGSMCALGVFLVAYNGHGADRWITTVAGIFAVGVALLPTKPMHPMGNQNLIGNIHLFCAFSLVILMAVMSLRFAKADHSNEPSLMYRAFGLGKGGPPLDAGTQRINAIYRGCALVIFLAVVLAVVQNFFPMMIRMHPWLFWCEAAAVWAFGLSWSTKGKTLQPVINVLRGTKPQVVPAVPEAAIPEADPATP